MSESHNPLETQQGPQGVRHSALLISQYILLPPAHHIDGGGQDTPLGKAAQGSAQHSKDDRHRDSPPFTANIMVSYEVSMIHSTASVTTNPNSVHCISDHPPQTSNFRWFSMACSTSLGCIPMYLWVTAALLCCKSCCTSAMLYPLFR